MSQLDRIRKAKEMKFGASKDYSSEYPEKIVADDVKITDFTVVRFYRDADLAKDFAARIGGAVYTETDKGVFTKGIGMAFGLGRVFMVVK